MLQRLSGVGPFACCRYGLPSAPAVEIALFGRWQQQRGNRGVRLASTVTAHLTSRSTVAGTITKRQCCRGFEEVSSGHIIGHVSSTVCSIACHHTTVFFYINWSRLNV
jgi:hypothetical protein